MNRIVAPELLDTLPPGDSRAIASRRDLIRINRLMGHAGGIIKHAGLALATADQVADLGAGDGQFLLAVARRLDVRPRPVELTLVDQQAQVSADTLVEFGMLTWNVRVVRADVFAWLANSDGKVSDVILANLFLHHFTDVKLVELLQLIAGRTKCFIAFEPRRSRTALLAARSLGLIGCNAVTRHDAVVSVRAGFRGSELTARWPSTSHWVLQEQSMGLFSHLFVAQRTD